MTPAQGVEDVVPGIVTPGGPPLPIVDTSTVGHPPKKWTKKTLADLHYHIEVVQCGHRKKYTGIKKYFHFRSRHPLSAGAPPALESAAEDRGPRVQDDPAAGQLSLIHI